MTGWYDGTGASSASTYTYISTTTAGCTANWVSDSDGYYYTTAPVCTYTYAQPSYQPPPETAQQKRERELNERLASERQAVVARENAEAKERSEVLLKDYIGTERFGELHRVGYIEVDSHKKDVRYRIHKDSYQMIDVLDKGDKVIDRLCIHTAPGCPSADEILAKVVLAELNEDLLNSKANHHRV